MYIYIDVLFVVNFLMTTFILYCTNKILIKQNDKKTTICIVLSGIVSSVLFCIYVVFVKNYMLKLATPIVIISLSILIAYRPKNIIAYIKILVYVYAVACAVGGVAFGLFYYTNINKLFNNLINFSNDYVSIKILVSSISVSYILIKIVVNSINKAKLKKQEIINVCICIDGESLWVNMLVDTGNTLKEPISNIPVVVVQLNNIIEILPTELQELYKINDVIGNIHNCKCASNIKIIPFKSVGDSNGIMIGVKPDYVQIGDIKTSEAIVGICDISLCVDNSYVGLMNPCLL